MKRFVFLLIGAVIFVSACDDDPKTLPDEVDAPDIAELDTRVLDTRDVVDTRDTNVIDVIDVIDVIELVDTSEVMDADDVDLVDGSDLSDMDILWDVDASPEVDLEPSDTVPDGEDVPMDVPQDDDVVDLIDVEADALDLEDTQETDANLADETSTMDFEIDVDPSQEAARCQTWNTLVTNFADEGVWSDGNTTPPLCLVGSHSGIDNALEWINGLRSIAGLPAVSTDTLRDRKAQACAMLMTANDTISHSPDLTWACYSHFGAEAAGRSLLEEMSVVGAIAEHVRFGGNIFTMANRRWMLAEQLGPLGIGSTDTHSCVWVMDMLPLATDDYTAWPPEGPVPFGVVQDANGNTDDFIWTIQSDLVDLVTSSIQVDIEGVAVDITTFPLFDDYGSETAIGFRVDQPLQVDVPYTVSVTPIGIQYEVVFVDC